MSAAAPSPTIEIATLRIELLDSRPPIWRRVEVPTVITLQALHEIVQHVMPWTDAHLWEFIVAEKRYRPPLKGDWDDDDILPAGETSLADVLTGERTTIDYTYDFGDCWDHRIAVTDVRAGDSGRTYPRYVTGKRRAPPDDCGGLPGFYALLAARDDPDDPDHDQAMETLADFDPAALDESTIVATLANWARRTAHHSRKR